MANFKARYCAGAPSNSKTSHNLVVYENKYEFYTNNHVRQNQIRLEWLYGRSVSMQNEFSLFKYMNKLVIQPRNSKMYQVYVTVWFVRHDDTCKIILFQNIIIIMKLYYYSYFIISMSCASLVCPFLNCSKVPHQTKNTEMKIIKEGSQFCTYFQQHKFIDEFKHRF